MNTLRLFATLLPLLAVAFARSALEEVTPEPQTHEAPDSALKEVTPEPQKHEAPASSAVNDLSHIIQNGCDICDRRYFIHYEAKKCKPIYDEGCKCPKRFDCPDETPTSEPKTVCEFRGQTFATGDDVPTTNPCEICSCQLDYFTSNPAISCIPTECGSMFHGRLDEGCYNVYDQGVCCPTAVRCTSDKGSNDTGVVSDFLVPPTCDFEEKTYYLGERMYSTEDPCLMCLCDQDFHGKSSNSCEIHDCELELRRQTFEPGCIPIYHEKTCCPIEYHCVTGSEEVVPIIPHSSIPVTSTNESDPSTHCTFGGKSYSLGDELDIHHPTNCVTCTCSTPPDFTCIHKACPHPPNDDYENCHSIYVPGQCCPTYQCLQHSAPVQCAPVRCQGDCLEVNVPGGCPMCMCQNLLCSPPKCDPGCEIDYDVPIGSCPTCKCSDDSVTTSMRPICDPVRCSPQCFEGISPQGCPMCVCGHVCYPPKCDEGCHMQTYVPEGQCPGCECPHENGTLSDLKVLCAPVKCPPMCHEVTGNAGCPMCQCDVMCSPPKCMPGCYLETPPYAGPCPGCVCGDRGKVPDIQCAPVKCEQGCTEVMIPNGCSMCKCNDILCSPPKCEEGCTIETEFAPGHCPGCKCPPTMPLNRPMCGPVKCGPECHEGISPQGCPMCVCGPLCSPPKCDEGCRIQTEIPQGQCPGCVCDGDAEHRDLDHKIRCSPVICPAVCHKAIGASGCETCECNPVPMCSPPLCPAGCRVESVPSSGPCPGCVCDASHNPLIQCSPVKCDRGCHQTTDFARSPCPYCVCDSKEDDDDEHEDDSHLRRIMCSPPKCQPGCFPKLIPPAPCPGCFCGKDEDRAASDIQCAPVKCDDGCHPETAPSRGLCPHCVCDGRDIQTDVQCAPVKCNDGCHPETTPSRGPCPHCVCDVRRVQAVDRIHCAPPMCEPGCYPKLVPPSRCATCFCRKDGRVGGLECPQMVCHFPCRKVALTPTSCPMCICDNFPICTIPECEPGCHPEVVSPSGCHECVCSDQTKKETGQAVQCAPVKCDPMCHEGTNQHGCPSCICGPACSPPKCKPGCEAKLDLSRGPCPGCTC